MSVLFFERLDKNELSLPAFATEESAGIDLAACLTRSCKAVLDAAKKKFLDFTVHGVARIYDDAKGVEQVFNKDHTGPATLTIHPGETIMVPLGWKSSFEKQYYLALHVRSSIGLRGLVLANTTGVVDSDYRGEIFAALRNVTNAAVSIEHGERIVQAILTPFVRPLIRCGKVDDTARGEGGFGSTGAKAGTVQGLRPELKPVS